MLGPTLRHNYLSTFFKTFLREWLISRPNLTAAIMLSVAILLLWAGLGWAGVLASWLSWYLLYFVPHNKERITSGAGPTNTKQYSSPSKLPKERNSALDNIRRGQLQTALHTQQSIVASIARIRNVTSQQRVLQATRDLAMLVRCLCELVEKMQWGETVVARTEDIVSFRKTSKIVRRRRLEVQQNRIQLHLLSQLPMHRWHAEVDRALGLMDSILVKVLWVEKDQVRLQQDEGDEIASEIEGESLRIVHEIQLLDGLMLVAMRPRKKRPRTRLLARKR